MNNKIMNGVFTEPTADIVIFAKEDIVTASLPNYGEELPPDYFN